MEGELIKLKTDQVEGEAQEQVPQQNGNANANANTNANASPSEGKTEPTQSPLKQKVKQIAPQIQKIKYPICQKGNFHEGELLNYVYLNTTNKDDVLGCAVCQEENKKGQWKPLKVVLHQALENSTKQAKSEFNCDEILIYLDEQQKQAEKEFNQIYESFNEKILSIKTSILSFFDKMKDQVLSHTSATTEINNLFDNVYEFNGDVDKLKSSVSRLVNFIPQEDEEEGGEAELEQKAIKINIESQYQEIQRTLEKGNKEIETLLETQKKTLSEFILQANIIYKNSIKFWFSNTYKHAQITLVSKNIVKSNGSNPSYRFAIMEPALPKNKQCRFAFKIKQGSTNNWLAVGICHKNTIVSKNYGFQFSNLGHGAYMISSNAGTWSTSQSAFNNVVKAFSFAKNDVVIVDYDPIGKTVKFSKEKKPDSTYKLDITHIDSDPLHACVLFYYVNDEIEFIQNYRPNGTN
ncbi:hypothetical protein ABPG72_021371 [Tetrahymena utriculariae]